MEFVINLILIVSVLVCMISSALGQGAGPFVACGTQLQDLPNPASDSCTAFFRCYQGTQYSVRCAAGQAFDFDRSRCRPANLVDCPLQLQRFQAPGVPHYLRPNGAPPNEDPRVEIRVIQVGDGTGPNGLVFLDNDGQAVPVNRQQNTNTAGTGQSQIRNHPTNPYLRAPIHRSPVAPNNQGRQNNAAQVPPAPRTVRNQAPAVAPTPTGQDPNAIPSVDGVALTFGQR